MIDHINFNKLAPAELSIPVLDVRTPAEYLQGHLPGALNLPLFTNEERVLVGTTYKQKGKQAAILLGFDLTGPKWSQLIRTALELAPDKKVILHCWRGGMRSEVVAWVLNLYGFSISILEGGYKAYRRWAMKQFEKNYSLLLVGGMTGSGKTMLLTKLQEKGEQVIDLEAIACHQGSAYGSMNKLIQPSQEQFENILALSLSQLDAGKPIWLEDENINIGKCRIPGPLWKQIEQSPVFDLEVGLEQRVNSLTQSYGQLDKDFLIECTERIRKRLGHQRTANAITAIQEDRMQDFIREVLFYYDKTYRTALERRPPQLVIPINFSGYTLETHASELLRAASNIFSTT